MYMTKSHGYLVESGQMLYLRPGLPLFSGGKFSHVVACKPEKLQNKIFKPMKGTSSVYRIMQ